MAENEPEEADERDGVEEDHEKCEESEHEDQTEELCFYDPNDIREIEVNSKNKATSLKKIILESIGLFKRANIILLKSSKEDNPEKINKGEINWVPFSDQDYETQVKFLANKTIAFKVYMDVKVQVEGRGNSYRTSLSVDPMEKLETCLKQKTLFWQFMMRGGHKCIVTVENKNEEQIIVAPDFFKQSFQDIGVASGALINLIEIKNFENYMNDDEGGEEEQEEMEAEQEENNDDEGE